MSTNKIVYFCYIINAKLSLLGFRVRIVLSALIILCFLESRFLYIFFFRFRWRKIQHKYLYFIPSLTDFQRNIQLQPTYEIRFSKFWVTQHDIQARNMLFTCQNFQYNLARVLLRTHKSDRGTLRGWSDIFRPYEIFFLANATS